MTIGLFDDSGYVCQCSEGYKGNPYVSDGCELKMSMNAALQVATIVMATARIRLEVLFANAQLDSRAMLLAQMDA